MVLQIFFAVLDKCVIVPVSGIRISMKQRIITVIGGSGFLGQYVVKELAKTGMAIRVVSRDPERALYLKTAGTVGQIVLSSANIRDEQSLKNVVENSWAVINLTGILYSRGKQNFSAIHAQGAERLAKIAKLAGCNRFIHISALAVDKSSKSHYARSKLMGEKAVLAAFPEATIVRPGILVGAEDNFFNKFAKLTSISPVIPLIGGGKTVFQPVYVDDVAKAIVSALINPATQGKLIELGGPQRYSFKELMAFMLQVLGKKRLLLPVPYALASLIAAFLELLPNPLLTRDQVQLLKTDNIVEKKEGVLTFDDLGIVPVNIETVIPGYLKPHN
jgi:uncharacterized protein YbjT (DUF2867 family)